MKIIYLFLLVILSDFELCAQDLPSEYICWSSERNLKWSDFKGYPDTTIAKNLVMYAGTAASIYIEGEWIDGLPVHQVICIFENQRSWTKDTTSSELLRHEQIHFNIAELYARKLRKGFDSLRTLEVDRIEKYDQLTNRMFRERALTDYTFDKATTYSVNKEAQDKWYEKVKAELAALAEYSLDSMKYPCVSRSEDEEE